MELNLVEYASGYSAALRLPFVGIGLMRTAASGALRRLVGRGAPIAQPNRAAAAA